MQLRRTCPIIRRRQVADEPAAPDRDRGRAGLLGAATALADAPGGRCPAKDFRGVLAAFIDSPAVQRAHVAFPLISSTVDPNAEPEPAIVRRALPTAAFIYPVMPGKAARDRDRLATRIGPLPGGDTEVKLAKPDTGYQLRYRFRRTGACWTLVEMSDDSL